MERSLTGWKRSPTRSIANSSWKLLHTFEAPVQWHEADSKNIYHRISRRYFQHLHPKKCKSSPAFYCDTDQMNYETFQPHSNLRSLVKCYWTLEVPAQKQHERQLIIPDGCIEMIFILGDDIKRYTSGNKFIIQPREMILGQITEPFFVEPTGYVNSFAVRFFPYGFTTFVSTSIKKLANKETPLELLFGKKTSNDIAQKIVQERDTKKRIKIIESFLLEMLNDRSTIDNIVKTTIDTMLLTKGGAPITSILKNNLSKRRQLERKFIKQIGISPKQLGKVIRLQAALKMLLNRESESLTMIAYESEYYDQAHFIKDFKEFTGTTPKGFLDDSKMSLSSLFYKKN